MAVFQAAELLIPQRELLSDWAVIACDQFTSQPDYWRAVEKRVEGKPSACHLIFPEAELGGDEAARIADIHGRMRAYLKQGLFQSFPEAFVYVERTLLDGAVRRGVLGVVDLEEYDYHTQAHAPVRASEQTVLERIPPRVRIRRGAALELSHVLLLMDDEADAVLGALEEKKEALPLLYDLELMQDGGHITGRLVQGADAAALSAALEGYEAGRGAEGVSPLLYAVGDGNHSLAAAKRCWETLKAENPALTGTRHPARFAMAELQNIRDEEQRFEPIHRLLLEVDVPRLLREAEAICAPGGLPVDWQAGERQGTVFLDPKRGTLPAAILQPFLDAYLAENGGRIDYIHGEETAASLAAGDGAIAFLLPRIEKADFFRGIAAHGVLPRKTFSMGHAQEKRYYLECRRIDADR